MNAINTIITKNVFDKFKITYAEYITVKGTLYFCTLPNGLTFDLLCSNEGKVSLWRFVYRSKAHRLMSVCKLKKSCYKIELSITDDDYLNFSITQDLALENCQIKEEIFKLINDYSKMITEICQ